LIDEPQIAIADPATMMRKERRRSVDFRSASSPLNEQQRRSRVAVASAAERRRDPEERAAADQQPDVVEHRPHRDDARALGVVRAELGAECQIRRRIEAEEHVEQEERPDEEHEHLAGRAHRRPPQQREAQHERHDHRAEERPPASEAGARAVREPAGDRVVDAVPHAAERDRAADQHRRQQGDVGVEGKQDRVQRRHADADHQLARAVEHLVRERDARRCGRSRV
jgi:hypothetical protein